MIDVHIFELKNYAALYVVSTHDVIRDLCVFADNHHTRGDLNKDSLPKRILFHNAYCCVIPGTLKGRLSTMAFIKALKKSGHLIDIDAYIEAFILANPEEAASVLTIPKADLIEIAKESDWGLIFEVDRNDVVERLQRVERD